MSEQDKEGSTPQAPSTAHSPNTNAWTEAPEQAAPAAQAAAAQDTSGKGDQTWERDLIAKVAFAAISEQRRARRWGIFFKLLVLAYIGAIFLVSLPSEDEGLGVGGTHTAVVEINGVIADGEEANADDIVTGLRKAYKDHNARGIILRINSPGGSPVQSGYVNDEIRRLRAEYPDKPIYAVISDICASGGYYIAAAAQQIYADKASLVGSIGVLMNGFGFTGTMEKLGVERRLLTAGAHKGFLDPFSPLKEADAAHMRSILEETHAQFIKVVREGRGEKLKETPELFSGFVWTGEKALELGLVDGLGSAGFVAREIIGEERIVNYTRKPNPFERFAERIGASFGAAVVKAMGLETSAVLR